MKRNIVLASLACVAACLALPGTETIAADVGTSDIQNGAVTTPKLKNGAVTTDKIANQAVGKGKLKDGAVTSRKLANGAVTLSKVGPKLKNAIGTFCPPNESVVGMDQDGNFVCESNMITGRIGKFGSQLAEHLKLGDWTSFKVSTGRYRIQIQGFVPPCDSEEQTPPLPNPVANVWSDDVSTGTSTHIAGKNANCENGEFSFDVATFVDQVQTDASFTFLVVDPR